MLVLEQYLFRVPRDLEAAGVGRGVAGLEQGGEGVHLHGEDRAERRACERWCRQAGGEGVPRQVAVAVELGESRGERRHGLPPGLRPAGRCGLDGSESEHDAVVGEHAQVWHRRDAVGAPGAGCAGQQQQPDLGLGVVEGLDERV